MDRFLVQVLGKYALWSEVVGAPLTPFVATLERLAAVCPPDGIRHIQVAQMRIWWHVAQNRAGEHSACLETPEALLAAYPDYPDEPAPPPPVEQPGPGRLLYEAVRDMGLLTSAWGPWDSLSREMQGDLAREAARLMPEQPVAEAPAEAPAEEEGEECRPCEHSYQMVTHEPETGYLLLFCSRCSKRKDSYLA